MAYNSLGLAQANGNRKLSKQVTDHTAVKLCMFGPDTGSDYKYYVELKEGWKFKRGRMAVCGSGFFNSAADFLYAEPVEVKDVVSARQVYLLEQSYSFQTGFADQRGGEQYDPKKNEEWQRGYKWAKAQLGPSPFA